MVNLILGAGLVGFGVFTILARIFKWQGLFAKKDAMIKTFGKTAGELIHISAYSVLPVIAGTILIIATI